MTLDKVIAILLLTLSIGFGFFYFSGKATESVSDQEAGVVFLSGMMSKINQISEIIITEKSGITHLSLKGDRWVVAEKSDYAADFSKIKSLLLSLAELKTIESKTSKPENYARLGVQGVDASRRNVQEENASTNIDLLDKAGNLKYSLIVGNEKHSRSPGGQSAVYVRKSAEEKSWLVSGKIKLPRKQTDWLNNKIINVSSQEIKRVEVNQPGKDQLRVVKAVESDENFFIEGLPKNAVLKSESGANSLAGALQNLTFTDVLSRGKFQASDKSITTVVFDTFDGWRLAAKLLEKEGKNFVWFDVIRDQNSKKPTRQREELGTLFSLWVYEINRTKATMFIKTLDDLIQTNQAEN